MYIFVNSLQDLCLVSLVSFNFTRKSIWIEMRFFCLSILPFQPLNCCCCLLYWKPKPQFDWIVLPFEIYVRKFQTFRLHIHMGMLILYSWKFSPFHSILLYWINLFAMYDLESIIARFVMIKFSSAFVGCSTVNNDSSVLFKMKSLQSWNTINCSSLSLSLCSRIFFSGANKRKPYSIFQERVKTKYVCVYISFMAAKCSRMR